MTDTTDKFMLRMTFQEVWEKAYKINCANEVRQKGNFSYLPWNTAWRLTVENFGHTILDYGFEENETHPDGSVTVHSWVIIGDLGNRRTMWMPVMGYNNKAVQNPDSRVIQDSKMRCLVKNLAMFGIGFHIFEGKNVLQPEDTWSDDTKGSGGNGNTISEEQQSTLATILFSLSNAEEAKFLAHYKIDELSQLPAAQYDRAVASLNAKKQ